MDLINQFYRELNKLQSAASFLSVKHLDKLKEEMLSVSKMPNANSMYETYVEGYFDFSSIQSDATLNSICIIATSSPLSILKFEFERFVLEVEVPPIYIDRKEILENIKKLTGDLFFSNGYKTLPIVLPKKSLAVHSGLAKYGRNNLVYVEGMGSYHRLTAFATDLPCDESIWYEHSLLKLCETCRVCQNKCPASALIQDTFIVNTDRCLTVYNEQLGEFPNWINPKWYSSLIGCSECQTYCPYNKTIINNVKPISFFNSLETKLILNNTPFSELPNPLREKLESLSLDIYYSKLARNLEILYKNKIS